MTFELQDVHKVVVTNSNPRTEFHGEDRVRAIDITFSLTGENTLLDLIESGLREHHYFNKAMTAGQEALPGVVIPLPNLRYPNLPTSFVYAKGQKWRGYRFQRDFGMDADRIDFTDAAFGGLKYEVQEGGTVTIWGTVSYNGEELADNILYGELSGLAAEGEIHITLHAPAQLALAKKGYRAGKADTEGSAGGGTPDGQQQLPGDGGDDLSADPEDQTDPDLDPESPEGALAATAKA